MKKIICVLLVLILFLAGCAGGGGGNAPIASLSDFEGLKVATLTGTMFASYIDPVIPNVEYKYFNSLPDTVASLSSGKADALALDMPVAKYLVAGNPGLVIFPDVVADDRYGFAVTKGSELAVKGNEALQKLKENGTVGELEKIWFSPDESKKVLSELNYIDGFNGSAGTLRYGCENTTVPMSYLGPGGDPVGFDLDIARRIAYELNMNIEFVPMSFDALLTSLASGRVDMVGGSMSITEERRKSVDFIGPYFEGGVVLVIKNERLA